MRPAAVRATHDLEVVTEAIARMEAAAASGDPTPDRAPLDDATDPANPSHRQVLRERAADLTMEDAMYRMYKAVCDNAVSLDAGMKSIRKMARQQYYHRALLWKIEKTKQARAEGIRSAAGSVVSP